MTRQSSKIYTHLGNGTSIGVSGAMYSVDLVMVRPVKMDDIVCHRPAFSASLLEVIMQQDTAVFFRSSILRMFRLIRVLEERYHFRIEPRSSSKLSSTTYTWIYDT
ncbi:hypothetical protein LENED_009074 [Lentinula edodes]|uniref:Uncharacterized protein n=1 Tax=Lentinula edodes TaxID=5353 RepID=A0A1Q3EIR2_LENED|nr:hypothetical protein LENED_009074 [Lentinula edodes]